MALIMNKVVLRVMGFSMLAPESLQRVWRGHRKAPLCGSPTPLCRVGGDKAEGQRLYKCFQGVRVHF